MRLSAQPRRQRLSLWSLWLSRIHNLYPSLGAAGRRIADYAGEHSADVVQMSVTEVAERTGTSEGSVVGFCKRVGATGFQQLKILLAREIVRPVQLIHKDLQPQDDAAVVVRKLARSNGSSWRLPRHSLMRTPRALGLAGHAAQCSLAPRPVIQCARVERLLSVSSSRRPGHHGCMLQGFEGLEGFDAAGAPRAAHGQRALSPRSGSDVAAGPATRPACHGGADHRNLRRPDPGLARPLPPRPAGGGAPAPRR